MKVLSLLFLKIFLGKGCDDQTKQDVETAVIEYTANTRGFYQKIIVQNQTVKVSRDRDGKDNPVARKISDADWKQLVTAFQNLKLDEIPIYKAPSEKRFHDGAAIAGIKITYKGKTYESQNFDHGNPPAEIAAFVNKITSFGKKE